MSETDELVRRLTVAAVSASRASKMMAEAKTERNQAAGDVDAEYAGLDPDETLEWKAAAELTRLQADREKLLKTIKPFSDCVFNDNGDMTVTSSNVGYDDFVRAYFACRRAAIADAEAKDASKIQTGLAR